MPRPSLPALLCCLLIWLALPCHAALLIEEPVQLQHDGVLYGTLLRPAGVERPPVALLVAGSGPTDRNGNQPGMRNDSLRRLARLLASQGVASLRFDKRGVAASRAAEPDERQLSVERYVDDLLAWSHQLQADPRLGPLLLIGHSEGGLIATLAAEDSGAQALVLLAACGRRVDDLLREQLRGRLPPPLRRAADRIMAGLARGELQPGVPTELQTLFRPSVQPYLISLFRQDPVAALAKTRLPVLVMQGDRDIQVGPEDARALAASRDGVRLALLPGVNHVLREVAADEPPLDSYDQPQRSLAPALGNELFRFLSETGILPPSRIAAAGR